jgi:hypothetical protein
MVVVLKYYYYSSTIDNSFDHGQIQIGEKIIDYYTEYGCLYKKRNYSQSCQYSIYETDTDSKIERNWVNKNYMKSLCIYKGNLDIDFNH